MENKKRCSWHNLNNETYVKYHDEEWGQPLYDDKKLYELLILECFQAGLSWECILNKRENFRKAFDNFDIDKIIGYGDEKKQELMNNPGIIRNRLKIKAAINNSIAFKEIHTSGHADINSMKKLNEIVNPDKTIIIHTENREKGKNIFNNVVDISDNQILKI